MRPSYIVEQREQKWIVRYEFSTEAVEEFNTQEEAQTKCNEMNEDLHNGTYRIRI